ncbi:Gfo/Idh/MocA family protein [Mycetocola spongiae]|uniref:Gfo/Idh/MocA family protein n=1 Tax=Mycetocola spongiae TaxID=2859226 RepID=UPI001CF5C25A|nr:Gfo/Idh/MocA family oxidoreductase [Mycetocola spongiae]UCR89857.1 Gfo/Idh/MocA family oxidoreductase [Mycetocola spongiae]
MSVGIGLIGAGVISDEYLAIMTTFPDLTVLFIADLDVERAAAQAAKYAIPGAGSVAELLADPRIEIVVNLTIPRVHAEVGMQILAAGKHVWSEKPFALDRESGRELLEQAKKLGLRAACAPDTFLGAGIQSARRQIEAGRIGTPLTALTILQSPGPESWHPNPDFLFQPGAGPLFDVGPYYFTTLVQLLGPVTRVHTTSSRARDTRVIGSGPRAGETFPVTVPTHISVSLEFAGGAIAQTILSFDSALKRLLFEVAGVEGTLILPDPNHFFGESELVTSPETRQILPEEGPSAGRGLGVLDLARSLRAGVPERASGDLAYHVLDIMVSTAESASSGEPVTVHSSVTVAPALPADWDPYRATLHTDTGAPRPA